MMKARRNAYARYAEMIQSVDSAHDRDTTAGKSNEVRAALGGYFFSSETQGMPPLDMLAICECGWRGTILDCKESQYDSSAESWRHLAGRRGYHWLCPACDEVVWKLYTVIS